MSPSENIDDYAKGWNGLMKLVRNGDSWSGNEKNRFFLNGRQGAFHEISHLAGLDQSEDGRGLAIVDWDQDGRLDLWYRNRSAPRLRLMVNKKESHPSVALKLEGTNCNRDAIGAMVELLPSSQNRRWVQSVKAGDLFLSQSSKWLHFGLGNETQDFSAQVLWPGGKKEIFLGIKAGRFHLKQGSGIARQLNSRREIKLDHRELTRSPNQSNAHILLPARAPFPTLSYRDKAAQLLTTSQNRGPKLVLLWSGTCPSCENNLNQVASQMKAIRENQLTVLALSSDGINGPKSDLSPAYELVEKTKISFPWGIIDQKSARKLHRFQENLFDRTPEPSVPLAILLDQNHRALAIYRGEFSILTILADLKTILSSNAIQLYHLAPPMKGTWFTNPLGQREVDRLFPVMR
ncbi:ASPIC/UnbV domain-containing protein [Akkermansiaceae bacterium]|nr:ASPIC/UnbV domain-containing protein [Akkermansiaceae bacterium]MDB4757531.1 ASPIC/UnbV domain-containing protein [Akkermansiaceae bacterium]